jgi:hypothetical protein
LAADDDRGQLAERTHALEGAVLSAVPSRSGCDGLD